MSTSNGEIRLRNQITASQEDNKSKFDNMWKKIGQVAKVSEKDRSSLEQIFVNHAQQRNITSSRDRWTMRQKQILDLCPPQRTCSSASTITCASRSSIVCGRRPEIEVIIVTSSRTEKAFESGKDDDVGLFEDKKQPLER